jgi:hypothetical protein
MMAHGYKVYKYVPYGNFMDTYLYLIRRLYENYDILKYFKFQFGIFEFFGIHVYEFNEFHH